MNLPAYTFPIFYAAILLIVFLAFFPSSTSVFVIMLILPLLVLYQAYIILKDETGEEQEQQWKYFEINNVGYLEYYPYQRT